MLLAVQVLQEQGMALAEAQERVEQVTQDMHAILGEHPPQGMLVVQHHSRQFMRPGEGPQAHVRADSNGMHAGMMACELGLQVHHRID